MKRILALTLILFATPAFAGSPRNTWLPGPGYYWECNSGVASYLQWNDQPATCVSDVYGSYTDYSVWRCASPWWLSAYSWRCE